MSTREFSQEELDSRVQHVPRSPQEHAEGIAKKHGISVKDMIGKGRHRHLCAARVELYRALRDQGWSYPAIGRFVHRDHTTVIMALAPIEKKRARALAQKLRER